MRKIKIRTPKRLTLKPGTRVVIVPDITSYCIKQIAVQEQEERQQFWQDVWNGLGCVGGEERD